MQMFFMFENAPPRSIKGAQLKKGWILFFVSALASTMGLRCSVIQVRKANEKTIVQLARCLLFL